MPLAASQSACIASSSFSTAGMLADMSWCGEWGLHRTTWRTRGRAPRKGDGGDGDEGGADGGEGGGVGGSGRGGPGGAIEVSTHPPDLHFPSGNIVQRLTAPGNLMSVE